MNAAAIQIMNINKKKSSDSLHNMGKLFDSDRSVGFYREKDAWLYHKKMISKGYNVEVFMAETQNKKHPRWYVGFK